MRPLRFCRRHALHAVAAGLEAQRAVDPIAIDAQHHFLEAAELARRLAEHLGLPALAFGKTRVHAQQVAREQRGLVAAGAGADFEERRAGVVGVLGQQQALHFVFELPQFGLGVRDLLMGHRDHVGILGGAGLGQHLARGRQIVFASAAAREAAGQLRDFGVLARQRHVLRHVGHDVLARQQEVELFEALGKAFQLLAEKGFHRWEGD